MQKLILGLVRLLPKRAREVLIGNPGAPSRFANFIHSLINSLPLQRFPVLPCAGELTGYRMRIDWHNYRAFVYGAWEHEVVKTLSEEVARGSFVIDIGAHIGFYTLLLSKLVGANGKVIAFEPLPMNFRVLEENLRLNRCSQAQGINKAVMDRSYSMIVTLPAMEPFPGGVSLLTDYGGDRVKVEAVSLDEFLADTDASVHLIKMDVEGAEELVLRGARKTIETFHPTLVIEVHHFQVEPEKHPVVALLEDWQYELRWINRWALTSHLLAKWAGKSKRNFV